MSDVILVNKNIALIIDTINIGLWSCMSQVETLNIEFVILSGIIRGDKNVYGDILVLSYNNEYKACSTP